MKETVKFNRWIIHSEVISIEDMLKLYPKRAKPQKTKESTTIGD